MPKLQYRVEITVELDVPEEHAAKITEEDVHEMAANAIGHHHSGKGVQVVVDGVAQWTDMHPDRYEGSEAIFADAFVDGWMDDGEIEIEEDGFDALEKKLQEQLVASRGIPSANDQAQGGEE